MKLSNLGKKVALGIATVSMLGGTAVTAVPAVIADAAITEDNGYDDTAQFSSKDLPNLNHVDNLIGAVKANVGAKFYSVDSVYGGSLPATATANLGTFRTSALVSDNSNSYYQISNDLGEVYVNTKDSKLQKIGTVHVDYNKHYGIQIWTKAGKPVVYNAAEAKATGHKKGDAKKLKGQTNWNVYGELDKHDKSGKTTTAYFDLGGDQYIDVSYVTFTPNAVGKTLMEDDTY